MKQHKLLLIALSLLLPMVTGCSDFLDKQPRGQAIPEDVAHYNGLFNSVELMNLSIGASYYSFWKSDELIFTPDCYNGLGNLSFTPQSIMNAIQYKEKVYRDDENCMEWVNCYNHIYVYNVIANGVMSASGLEEHKKYLRAEARVTRAYMYFLLSQWFAMPYDESKADTELTVPLVTEANAQAKNFSRATMRQMYDFIVKEMEEACPDLENRKEHRLRVYMPTGYTMLGKVYWMMGKYDQALKSMNKALELLAADNTVKLYDYNVLQAPYGYKEVPMNMMSTVTQYKFVSDEVLYNKQNPLSTSYQFQYSGVALAYLKPEYYALFNEFDLRRNRICTVNMQGKKLQYPFAGFVGDLINFGVELPELYLILAECEARVGDVSLAKGALIKLREKRMLTGHADIPANVVSREDLIRFCVDEQTREYIGTGYRWFNMRRLWNDPLFPDHTYTHYDGENTYTLNEAQLKMEIPESVLIWNNSWRN